MDNVLFALVLILNFFGIIVCAIYIVTNTFFGYNNQIVRNETMLKISRLSMIFSLVFSLLAAFFSENSSAEVIMERVHTLFLIIGVSWVTTAVICGIVMMVTLIVKKYYSDENSIILRKVLILSAIGASIALFMTWLFA